MVLPPCFRLAAEVFPLVRAEACRRLVAKGWTQVEVARALGISQAMVSRHAAKPRPRPADVLVGRMTDELLAGLDEGTSGPSPWCETLAVDKAIPAGSPLLAELLAAERVLKDAAPLGCMPQIGLNIACTANKATTPSDVLSYPARLVEAGGALLVPAPPAFGASGHLARLLLYARGRDPSLGAICNVRGGPVVMAAARRAGWDVGEIGASRAGDGEAPFRRAAATRKHLLVAYHDGKAAGIEPCLYVLGRDAGEVAQRVLELEQALAQA